MGAGANEQVGGIQAFVGVTAEPVDAHVHGGRVFGGLGAHVEWGSVISDHTMLEPSRSDPTMLEEFWRAPFDSSSPRSSRVGVAWSGSTAGVGVRAWGRRGVVRGPRGGPKAADPGCRATSRRAGRRVDRFVHAEITYEHIAGADWAGLAIGVGL